MVPLEAPYPGVYIDTFIFFLRSLCKIIWMNVHYFPNAPRTIRLKMIDELLVPYWGGTLRLLTICLSVCLSVTQFSRLPSFEILT